MNPKVLHDCLHEALAGRLSFSETVGRMLADGVQWYHADLVGRQKIHYSAADEVHAEAIPLPGAPAVADQWNLGQVQAAIRSIQQGQINYPEFLHRIMAAGTTSYTVYLHGGKAIYFGRRGDFHVETFPGNR
jgi:uncharacterized protein YbcV (DUF1398 family)